MSLVTQLQDFATRVGTEFKTIRILISGSGTGDVSGLNTTATNLVDAINEVGASAGTTPGSETVAGVLELATTAETVTGTDTTRAVHPAGVAAAVAALVDSAPGTLDTLNELAAALGDDPNFASSVSTSLAGKQPLDTDLTAIAALTSASDKMSYATGAGTWALADLTPAARALLDDVDVATMRTTLDVYSKAEIGDPATNFVTTFEAGLA